MNPIIPFSPHFDQSTLGKLIDADPVVQRYRQLFALFDWSALDPVTTTGPGRPAHPLSAYIKALLVRIAEHLSSTPRWRAYLLDHPLLVLASVSRHVDELGRPSHRREHVAAAPHEVIDEVGDATLVAGNLPRAQDDEVPLVELDRRMLSEREPRQRRAWLALRPRA